MADRQALPDVLAWPLDKARAELERADIAVCVKEALLPNRPPVGSELRVARVRAGRENVELVVVKAQTKPAGNVPPI